MESRYLKFETILAMALKREVESFGRLNWGRPKLEEEDVTEFLYSVRGF